MVLLDSKEKAISYATNIKILMVAINLLSQFRLKHLRHPRETLTKAKSLLLTKPYRNPAMVSLCRLLSTFRDPNKWVFIVGCYNSGTTLLRELISTHPEISSLDEGVFKTDELITPEELGWTRMWSQVLDDVRLRARDDHVDVEELKKDWGIFFDHRKPVFLEKSIVNSARMTWLQKNFPNSYFIFLVRNGYAVTEGIRRKAPQGRWSIQQDFTPSYPIELCAKQWVVNNQIIEKDSKAIKNFIKVHYEDLCRSPQEIIEKLWHFVGLSYGPKLNREKRWRIGEKNCPVKNMNPRSFANLSKEDVEKIESEASDMLEYYGYPLLSEEVNYASEKNCI